MKGWCISNMNKNNSKKEIGILDWLKAIYEITVIIIKLYKKEQHREDYKNDRNTNFKYPNRNTYVG